MLDCFVYGKVDRISPEAPVAIFQQSEEKFMLGGVGNVLSNIVSLGANAHFFGFIGDDASGQHVESLLSDIQCKSTIKRLSDSPTILKTRLIANNNHILRLDKEKVRDIDMALLQEQEQSLEEAIQQADIVLLSDYAKGTLTRESTAFIIERCKRWGKKVLVDPKGCDYAKYAGATLVKPNLKEFSQATQIELSPEKGSFIADLKRGAQFLFNHCGIENVLVTLSEHGMAFISRETPDEVIQIPTEAKHVFDVSGAGDTSLAMLGVALASGAPASDAMRLANIASGVAIGKLGTASVSQEEVYDAISEGHHALWRIGKKLLNLEDAKEICAHLKAKGKVVGFTNGCFDLMHLGHLHSFAEAKKHCDWLVVGVNSDSSVKRYKGEDRPVQDEQTRASLVAALEQVDYVVIFDDDTALPLIEELRPDIIAKEGYALADWPEAQFVESYGGKSYTLPRLEGYSTSSTLSRLLNNQ